MGSSAFVQGDSNGDIIKGPRRDLSMAKDAYAANDVQMSILAHSGAIPATEAHTTESGKHVKSIVFGGMDGIITTFALVSGAAGADLDWRVVLVLGIANLIADGISMGFGDYTSDKAELDYQIAEQKREKWELENFREGELQEMIELYISKGIERDDAEEIVGRMAKYQDFFVNHMLVQELNIMPPDNDGSPAMAGLVTFLSFMAFGSVPLLSFLVFVWADFSANLTFALACILTACALFGLGVFKGRLTSTHRITSGLQVLLNGVLAAGSAYFIGWGVGSAVDIKSSCS